MARKRELSRGTLIEMPDEEQLAERRRIVEAAGITPEKLATWYATQHAHTRTRVVILSRWIDAHRPDHPDYWLTRARFDRGAMLLERLETAEHCLVCPEHGIPGLEPALTATERQALSVWDTVHGQGTFPDAWVALCETCALPQLRERAARLLAWDANLRQAKHPNRHDGWEGIEVGV